MYGLVNKALQDFVCRSHGREAWERIRTAAGVNEPAFVSMKSYPDAVTYSLVGAASEELRVPAGALLEQFGEHWMVFTANEGYGDLIRTVGSTFFEFIATLNGLHARLSSLFPMLRPPGLRLSDITATSARLHYTSQRAGLAPFVIGLLKGLGRHFDVQVTAVLDKAKADGHDHDEFLVTIAPRTRA